MSTFYEKYRIYDGNVPRTPKLGNWDYDQGENCRITRKMVMLNNRAVEGKCYLKFLIMLPIFDRVKIEVLEKALDYMEEDTGPYPVGKDLIVRLATLNIMVESGRLMDGANIGEPDFNPEIFNQMMKNNHRFKISYAGDVMHVDSYYYEYDNPENRDEDHGRSSVSLEGFSSRAMISLLGASNKLVGGSVIDLESLFGVEDSNESDYTMTPEQLEVSKPTVSLINEINNYQATMKDTEPEMTDEASTIDSSISQTIIDQHEMIYRLKTQLSLQDKKYEKTKDALKKFMMNSGQSQSPITGYTGKTSTVVANDSISNVGRNFEKRKLSNGTIFTVSQNQRIKEEDLIEIDDLQPSKQVIVGYRKTISMQEKERAVNQRVKPINGLSSPFKDNRLNLLMHFHTAVETNMPIDDTQGYSQSLQRIMRHKSKSPSEELAKQIIDTTFNFEELTIVANPFRLPFIEVGMILSDNCLVTCFTLLKSEFETLWFSSMKSLMVPSFHKKFWSYSETAIGSMRKPKSRDIATDRHKSQSQSRRHKTLSLFTESR